MNPRLHLNGPLAWSAASLLAIVVVVVMTLPALARAALGPDLSGESVDDVFARLMEEHGEVSSTYRNRFDGRSVFFKPPRKAPPPVVRRPPPPRPKETVTASAPPPPPPPPERPMYAGPGIGGIIGDRVYFNGDLRVDIGEERNGLKVIAVDAPWGAKVEYRGWEYDLSLFEHGGFFDTDETDGEGTLGGFIESDEDADAGGFETIRTGAVAPLGSGSDVVIPAASSKKKDRGRRRAKPAVGDE